MAETSRSASRGRAGGVGTSTSRLVAIRGNTRGALNTAPFIDHRAKAVWTAQIIKLEVHFGVPMANAKATVEPTKGKEVTGGGLTATAAEAPISALVELMHSAAALIQNSGGSGLVVFVDEVHAANTKPLGIVLNALQNLDGSPTNTALTAVFAGLPAAPEVLTEAATFGKRSQFVTLDRLDDTDTAVALVKPAQASGVAWDRDALGQVVADTDGYPYFVRPRHSTSAAHGSTVPGPRSCRRMTIGLRWTAPASPC